MFYNKLYNNEIKNLGKKPSQFIFLIKIEIKGNDGYYLFLIIQLDVILEQHVILTLKITICAITKKIV